MSRRIHAVILSSLLLLTAACTRQGETGATGATSPTPAPPPTAPAATTTSTALPHGITEEAFKAMHEPASSVSAPLKGQMIDLPGTTSKAYLSLPDSPVGMPGVTVIHEWWGLNDNIKHWADRLAAEGYAAVAVDLYGGKVTTTPDDAMAAMQAVDQTAATATLLAAHRFLAEDPRVKATKRGSLGWCFGGKQSLQLALAAPDLDACVIYYGHLETDPEKLKAVRAPICGIFANQDQSITPADVDAFDAALTQAGVEHEIHRYDADHAFANPSGTHYDQPASKDAWEKARTFLARHLR